MAKDMTTIVKLSGVSKSFSSLEVIRRLDLAVREREVVSLIGPSGCGKSTTLRIIAGLEQSDGGSIERGFKWPAFIFQEPRLLSWRTALQNVLFVLNDRVPDQAERQQIASHYLELMGLGEFKNYYPAQLSGGMKRRVSIARALAIEPDLILMDEPLSDLDLPLRLVLIDNLREILKEEPRTVIYVTHDIRDALLLSDRIYVLTAKPMRVREELSIDSAMERRMSNPELLKLEGRVIEFLKEESLRRLGPRENLRRYGPARRRKRLRRET